MAGLVGEEHPDGDADRMLLAVEREGADGVGLRLAAGDEGALARSLEAGEGEEGLGEAVDLEELIPARSSSRRVRPVVKPVREMWIFPAPSAQVVSSRRSSPESPELLPSMASRGASTRNRARPVPFWRVQGRGSAAASEGRRRRERRSGVFEVIGRPPGPGFG